MAFISADTPEASKLLGVFNSHNCQRPCRICMTSESECNDMMRRNFTFRNDDAEYELSDSGESTILQWIRSGVRPHNLTSLEDKSKKLSVHLHPVSCSRAH